MRTHLHSLLRRFYDEAHPRSCAIWSTDLRTHIEFGRPTTIARDDVAAGTLPPIDPLQISRVWSRCLSADVGEYQLAAEFETELHANSAREAFDDLVRQLARLTSEPLPAS